MQALEHKWTKILFKIIGNYSTQNKKTNNTERNSTTFFHRHQIPLSEIGSIGCMRGRTKSLMRSKLRISWQSVMSVQQITRSSWYCAKISYKRKLFRTHTRKDVFWPSKSYYRQQDNFQLTILKFNENSHKFDPYL